MIVNRQRQVPIAVPRVEELARAAAGALRIAPDSFTVVLVSDAQIHRLNRRFRGRSAPTDVLSFPVRWESPSNGYLGDVMISLQTARRQARRLGHSLSTEVGLLIVHGLLHLLGYDHARDHGEMNRREHVLRRRLRLE